MVVEAPARPRLACFVSGTPVTKGSLRPWHKWRPLGNCILGLSEQQGVRLKQWRADVAEKAAQAMAGALPFDGPLAVRLAFWFPLPKAARPETLGSGAPVWTNKRNDIDKLARAILDALTDAAVWHDDSQVSDLYAIKRYGDAPGVFITVEAAT